MLFYGSLKHLWTKYAAHGVEVVAVHTYATEAVGHTWLTSLGVTFPAVQDTSGIFASYTSSSGVPHSYIIGRDMIIRKDLLGLEDESVMEGHLLDVLYMRDPIDLELVMDVSDSMNDLPPGVATGDPKIALMKQAATIITDFLKDHGQADDRMGLVWFTDDATEYQDGLGHKLFPVQPNWTALRAQICGHPTGMFTAMGAGMQKGFDTLSASTHHKFMIVYTDGMQNIEPKVTPVGSHFEIIDSGGWVAGAHSSVPAHPGVDLATYHTRVHPIGIGIEATYASLLHDAANATGGFYRGTYDPGADLDLIYFVDLCNCMAGGSPAIAHHSIGRIPAGSHEAVESFYLNRSVRKITVVLSWQEAEGGDLTFWLYAPDGTLLHLAHEMQLYENHCLATIFLPRTQNGASLPHAGQWQMVIRGETGAPGAGYHAFVIAEDQEVHFHLEIPRKTYQVGDILPIKVLLQEAQRSVVKVSEIVLETAQLRLPPAELCARYKSSHYEMVHQKIGALRHYQENPLALKLRAMATDPAYSELLKPARKRSSLLEGSLECKIADRELVIPVALTQSGLISYKVTVQCETRESGPICRTDMISVHVGAGAFDPGQTKISAIKLSEKDLAGVLLYVTPKNGSGQLLGPGLEHEFKIAAAKHGVELEIEDLLDGAYRIEIAHRAKATEHIPVNIMLQGRPIWQGELKGE